MICTRDLADFFRPLSSLWAIAYGLASTALSKASLLTRLFPWSAEDLLEACFTREFVHSGLPC